jgi:hypothetical protein
MAERRECGQCGTVFAPQREHARFCSPKCRIAWARENTGSAPGDDALDWSVTAMRDVTDRLLEAKDWDRAHAFVAISEAVWWATMVDATLVRYYPAAYQAVLADHEQPRRLMIEDTFGGLRYVRNNLGYEADYDDMIESQPGGPGQPESRIAAWTWRPLPEPDVGCLSPRAAEWEITRYRSYQAQLAKRPVGDTFRLAADFLQQAADSGFGEL